MWGMGTGWGPGWPGLGWHYGWRHHHWRHVGWRRRWFPFPW